MNTKFAHWWYLVFLYALPLSAAPLDSSVDVVRLYCQLDFDGNRLSSRTYAKIGSLSQWEDEPGWDTIILVKAFDVMDSSMVGDSATCTVRYDIVAILAGEKIVFPEEPEWQKYSTRMTLPEVCFELSFVRDCWKVFRPVVHPHVSIHCALKHIQKLLDTDKKYGTMRPELFQSFERLKARQEARLQYE